MAFTQFPLDISAIVVDLDGTMLHTAPELCESANRMLRDMDYTPVSQELLASYIGNGISWLVKRALTGDKMDAQFLRAALRLENLDDADHPRARAVRPAARRIVHAFDLDAIGELRRSWGVFRDRRPEMYGALSSLDGRSRSAAAG